MHGGRKEGSGSLFTLLISPVHTVNRGLRPSFRQAHPQQTLHYYLQMTVSVVVSSLYLQGHPSRLEQCRRLLSRLRPANDSTVDSDASSIVIIGGKSKVHLNRVLADHFQLTFEQIGPTFANAAAVADLVIKNGIKYDSVVIVYNTFVSAISYEAAVMEVKGEEALEESSV